jgi:hypothetical protein
VRLGSLQPAADQPGRLPCRRLGFGNHLGGRRFRDGLLVRLRSPRPTPSPEQTG